MNPLLLLWLAGPAHAADPDLSWVPERWSDDAVATPPAGAASGAPWWTTFDDADLAATVTRGLAANPDLAALSALTDQQRALAAQGLAPVLPSLSFDVLGTVGPTDSQTFGFGIDVPDGFGSTEDQSDHYISSSARFNASLGVDLWGRSLTAWKASRLDALASQGDRDAQALVLSTAIGSAWLDVAAASRQVEIVTDQVRLTGDLLDVVRARYEGGAASALDVLQQEQTLAAVRAQLPLARAQLRTSRQRLAVLTGRDPIGDLPAGPSALPAVPADPALGSPQDLIEHRPDVRAALDRVDAAGARRSAAMRAVLPTLGFTASAGWQYYWRDEWSDTDTWSVGGSLSVPIFGGGQRVNAIRQAGAARTATARQLESTVRSALQEVESARVTDHEQAERTAATADQLRRAREAWQVAADQYGAGTTDFLQVQSALSTLLSAELTHLQARRDRLGARLSLHQALGGAWTRDLDALLAAGAP